MIRSKGEYEAALQRLAEDEQNMAAEEDALRASGLTDEQVERGMQPLRGFHLQLRDDIDWYDRAKRGDIGIFHSLTALGRGLIALRIARDLTQAELARRLGVDESQVSRDERNEYHGITLERAQRVIDALRWQQSTQFTEEHTSADERTLAKV